MLGIADLPLELGGVCFFQTAIVCGILPDVILGQEFMRSLQAELTTGRCSLDQCEHHTMLCWWRVRGSQ